MADASAHSVASDGHGDVPVVLAIDLGTGGPKAAVVAADGATRAWTAEPVATRHTADGGAEQDPEQMWTATVVATRRVLAAWGGDPHRLEAIAVTSQYMSTVPVAADGRPVGPCLTWMDTRGGVDNIALLTDDSFMLWVTRHGLIPLPSGTDGLGHIGALRRLYPDSYAAAAAFVEPMDYLVARLTGRVSATQSTAWSLLCCDNGRWDVPEYDADLVAAARLDPARLPPLRSMRGWAGELTSGAATELGLPAGLPVTPGTIDSITSAVGSGAVDSTRASIVIGTTAVYVSHIGEQRNDLGAGLLAVPSPLSQRWYVMAENGLGGRALEWFLRDVVHPADGLTAAASTIGLPEDAYERLERVTAGVAAGCGGVQFLPWLLGSIAPVPADEVRGAFVGLGLDHSRAHMARAVLEGVATNLAWLAGPLQDFVGERHDVVRFGGGGALSNVWSQCLANALDKPVHQLADPRATNARGAAFLALAELGYLDLDRIDDVLQVAATYEPDPAARIVMDAALDRHRTLHGALTGRPTV